MSPAVIVTIILVVGIALVIAATLADRRSAARLTKADATEISSAGADPAASERPVSIEPPAYITSEQLLRGAPPAARFSPDQERELAAQLTAPSTVRIDCRLAAPTLATHTGERAILDQPRVLVCADGIGQFREVLSLLGSASVDMQAPVIAAPTIDADALQTIIANKLAGKLQVCVVLGGADALAELAAAVGSRPAPLADRQAGAIALTDLGRPARLVASPSACWVISAVA